MSNSFNLMDTNPNLALSDDRLGSAGCLCSELGCADTQGPYIVFATTETDNIHAPFPVICAPCVLRAAKLVAESTQAPAPKRKPTNHERLNAEDGPSI